MITPNTLMSATILVVDDQLLNADLLTTILEGRGYSVVNAYSGPEALDAVQAHSIDLILLDVSMPGMDGYQVCAALKAEPRYQHIPVLFISAISDLKVKVEGFRVGGVDYITKPYQREELLARVVTHLELSSRQREIERLQQVEISRLQEMNGLKDDLLQMVSHDLKTPLSAIKGGLSILESTVGDKIRDDSRATSGFDIIRRSTRRMTELVLNVLDLARMEGRLVARYESVALAAFLQKHAEDALSDANAKNIAFTFSPPPAEVKVALSPALFSQVVENLLSNAIKYTKSGGSIALTADATDNAVAIQVSDTGYGIPAEAIPHLFEKYFRVHEDLMGTGLGLAIVKAIVDLHQGTVEVESEVGQGSRFTVILPIEPLPA
jgi:two-component system, sensor histidine kinase and response regulator